MTVSEAMKTRIEFLLNEKQITLYRLTLNAGISHGTMHGIMSLRNKAPNFQTVLQIANGFDMTVSEFLDDSLFHEDNLD